MQRVLLFYGVNGALAEDIHNETMTCDADKFTNLLNEAINIKEYCKDKPCITKCCKEKEIFIQNGPKTATCTNVKDINLKQMNKTLESLHLDFSDVKIYASDIKVAVNETTKTLLHDFHLVRNNVFTSPNCNEKMNGNINKYILEDGGLAEDMHEYMKKDPMYIHKAQTFCVDRFVTKTTNKYIYYTLKQVEEDTTAKRIFIVAGYLISSFFLFLVLLVYSVLPILQNIKGKLVMAYVTSLLLAYLLKAIHTIRPFHYTWCQVFIGPITYFLFLSSILWLNVMSYDIWWGLRGLRLQRAVNRRGALVKFLWYWLYAWGVAAAMTIAAVIVDNADLTNWPNVTKPDFKSCLKGEEDSVTWYLYTPIGILIMINFVLFLLTVYNHWLITKEVKNTQDSGNNKAGSSVRVYFGISLLMGLSWMLEIVQSFYDNDSIYLFIPMNAFNILLGVAIFLMFICKQTILDLLCERFNIKTKRSRGNNTNSVTNSTVTRSRSSNKSSYYRPPNNDAEITPGERTDAVNLNPTLTPGYEKKTTKTFFV